MNPNTTVRTSLPSTDLSEHYLLRDDIVFLNHGSFGACPKPVFDAYQEWQRELELNPVMFMGRRNELLATARSRLAQFAGTDTDNVVFVPNATHGINIVARSLKLGPGDEVLSTDHEYGAIDRTWRFNCQRQGATLVSQPIPVPIQSADEVVEQFWRGVNENTKVIALSHITSPTALVMPIEQICHRAQEAGIITVIDGAHAPGQVDLNLDNLSATFYSGNAHKWMSSPKGSAFLYARPGYQEMLEPLIVSHGWQNPNPGPSRFLDYFGWVGTDDPAAYLSVAAAIDFMETHNWREVQRGCHKLAMKAQSQLLQISGLSALGPESMQMQMVAVPIPGQASNYKNLWDRFRIIVPIFETHGHTVCRVSIQAYNKVSDVERLVEGIGTIHAEHSYTV